MANGGTGRAHGGACVSGSGSAPAGGGVSEAGTIFLNIDAGCQKRVAGIVMQEVQRATRSSLLQCLHPAGTDADPIPQLEFDQTFEL